MGSTVSDQVARRTAIMAGTGTPAGQPGSDTASTRLVLPLEGVREAGAGEYLARLRLGVHLTLDDTAASIDVYHNSRRLGYLGGSTDDIREQIAHARCTLYSHGGDDGTAAAVSVWL